MSVDDPEDQGPGPGRERNALAGRWRLALPLLIVGLAALAVATYAFQLSEAIVYSLGLLIVVVCGYVWVSGIR